MQHDYTVTLHPYGQEPGRGIVQISPSTHYGYFELRDGSEGGGLWFEPGPQGLELVDFDGQYSLPRKVSDALRAHGYTVDEIFNP